MTIKTAVRVCAWCGIEGAGMCPDCAEKMRAIQFWLKRERRFSRAALKAEMKRYVKGKKK